MWTVKKSKRWHRWYARDPRGHVVASCPTWHEAMLWARLGAERLA